MASIDASEIKLTAKGREDLMKELEWREGEKHDEIVAHIQEARGFGDLSENAEYDAAKEEQSKNEARIADIRAILAKAQVVEEPEEGATDELVAVSIGCTVTLVDGDGEAQDFTIVGTTETNSLQHKISNESPVGKAIIGRYEGDTVQVSTPSGKVRIYTIAKITR